MVFVISNSERFDNVLVKEIHLIFAVTKGYEYILKQDFVLGIEENAWTYKGSSNKLWRNMRSEDYSLSSQNIIRIIKIVKWAAYRRLKTAE